MFRIDRPLAVASALCGALAVIVGAFAAHGAAPAIKTLLTTGGHYMLVHAVLGLICAIWPGGGRLARLAGWLVVIGGLIFMLALWSVGHLGLKIMGAVAPIGGVLMIAGWIVLAFAAIRSPSVNS